MIVKEELFGKISGKNINKVSIINKNDLEINIINYGGIILSIKAPDKNGKLIPLTLGYDTLEEYISDKYYFGALIGRFANRIKNGFFKINDKVYQLRTNEPSTESHLHGGKNGFHKALWQMSLEEEDNEACLELSYLSKDGEEGYPGNLQVNVKYTLNDNNQFIIEYNAKTDKTTPVNLTQHTYWNIAGFENSKNILGQKLFLNSDKYLELDEKFIPTGKINPVKNSPYDFTSLKEIGADIDVLNNGYDIYYIAKEGKADLKKIAKVVDPVTGRTLDVSTTAQGLQLYTSNFIENVKGYDGNIYNKYAALCLETHSYPDSISRAEFKKSILEPGEVYYHKTVFELGF